MVRIIIQSSFENNNYFEIQIYILYSKYFIFDM